MYLQIITPDHVIFEGEVEAVTIPGKNGEFQILNNHAPIVSSMSLGKIKIKPKSKDFKKSDMVYSASSSEEYLFDIKGGIVEMNNNKIIILAS